MPKPELTDEEIAEDVMNDDRDPMDAIRDIRREEGVAEEDLPISESEVLEDTSDDNPADKEKDDSDKMLKDLQDNKKEEEEEEEVKQSEDEKAAKVAADLADKAIEEADKAADKAADKDINEEEEEADKEEDKKTSDNKKTDSDKEDTPKVYKFKANGQDFEFSETEILEQFETVFGQSMDYTQKMQKIAPYRKMISALEQEGVTHDTLNLALDALKGDKGAIKKMLKKAKIDPYDLTSDDEEETPYIPGNYGKDETQLEIEEITSRIQNDEEFKITTNVIDEQWDDNSRKMIAENPNMITGLHNDIVSGLYNTVSPIAMKMKVLDGNTKSDIEYYMLAGQQVAQKFEADEKLKSGKDKVDELNADAQDADSKFDKASLEADRKRAASSTGKRTDRKGVIDYLDDDDEAYEAWYKNLNASI